MKDTPCLLMLGVLKPMMKGEIFHYVFIDVKAGIADATYS